jgi:hypothetical protein
MQRKRKENAKKQGKRKVMQRKNTENARKHKNAKKTKSNAKKTLV